MLALQMYSQSINQKKVVDINFKHDYLELNKVGYGEKEMKILSIILIDRINENKNVDTLTVKNCLPMVLNHKLYNNDFFKTIEKGNNFKIRDKLIHTNDSSTLNNINKIDSGIIVFCSIGSINCDNFLTDLSSKIGIRFLEKNNLYYYSLSKNEQYEYLVRKQKEILDSNIQPHFAVVKKGKIIKDFIGYKNLSELINKIEH